MTSTYYLTDGFYELHSAYVGKFEARTLARNNCSFIATRSIKRRERVLHGVLEAPMLHRFSRPG